MCTSTCSCTFVYKYMYMYMYVYKYMYMYIHVYKYMYTRAHKRREGVRACNFDSTQNLPRVTKNRVLVVAEAF